MGKLIIQEAGIEIDVEIPIPLNKEIADIMNPSSRGGEWSKTVSISGYEEVNRAFSHIYDININLENDTQYSPSFNPNKRAKIVYQEEGIVLLRGFMRLLSVVKMLGTSQLSYELQVFNPVSDFWNEISNKRMEDIDLSIYDHTLDADNVIDSWSSQIIENGLNISFAKGTGYVHALINKRPQLNAVDPTGFWDVGDTTPCIYAKELVDKIYEGAGQEYESGGFFDSTEFKNWVVPYNGVGLGFTDSEIASMKVVATTNVVNTISAPVTWAGVVSGRVGFNTVSIDPGSNFSTGGAGYYEVPQTAKYQYFPANFDITFDLTSGAVLPDPLDIQFRFEVWNTTSGVKHFMPAFEPIQMPAGASNTVTLPDGEYSFIIDAEAGDRLQLYLSAYCSSSIDMEIASGAGVTIQPISSNYTTGSEVRFTKFFNRELTQKQFMLDLVRTFNLWIGQAENGKHIVKTRDAYLSSDTLDLTPYLNTAKEVEYKPMGALKANPYVFTYEEDNDTLNELHKFRNLEPYGTKTYRVDNDFIKNEKVIKVSYAPTPMQYFRKTGLTLPDITFIDKEGKVDPQKTPKYRLLRFEGLKSCNPFVIQDSTQSTINSQYPLIGHIDDPNEPTLEGHFGMPKQHYLKPSVKYSGNTMFHQYHFKQYAEMTDRNSKIVTAWLNIPSNLYNDMTFDKLYWFDNSYFRLNKVIDYRPEQDTKCEFVKYNPFTVPALTTASGNGGADETDGISDRFPTYAQPRGDRENEGLAQGNGNKATKDVVILGDYNTTFGTTQGGILGGNNINIHPNVTRAVVLNSDDQEITEDGLYLNNYNATEVYEMQNYQTSSDLTSENTTLVSISDFETSLLEDGVYSFRVDMQVKNTLTTDGFKIGFNSSGSVDISGKITGFNTDGNTSPQEISINSTADTFSLTTMGTADKYYSASVDLIIRPNADTTFNIQYSSGNGTGVMTIKQGATLQVKQL